MNKFTLPLATLLLLLMSGCSGSPAAEQNSSTASSQVSDIENGSWVRIDAETFWHNDGYFKDDSYNFPNIAFEYPSVWRFSCCGDMDTGSKHHICSTESFNEESQWCEKARITLLDWSLSGCPSGAWDCSMEQIVPKTAEQKYNDEIRNIQANTGATILPEIHLTPLNADAFVYAKNDSTRSYLINLGDDVIDIEFTLDDEIDDGFITEFLSRIERDGIPMNE